MELSAVPNNHPRSKREIASADAKAPLPKPIEEDYEVAKAVVRARAEWIEPGSDGWDDAVELYAAFRVEQGADWFDIFHGLREPVTRFERLIILSCREGWSDAVNEERFGAFVERPVDADMLDDMLTSTTRRLDRYARVLGVIIDVAHDQRDTDRSRAAAATPLIDRLWRDVVVSTAVSREEFATASEFLKGLTADRNMPARCGGWSGVSAHALAHRLVAHGHALWQSNVEIERKSQIDPAYTHAATAADLMKGTLLADEAVPKLPDLIALLEIETRVAKRHLAASSGVSEVARVRVAEFEPTAIRQLGRVEPVKGGEDWSGIYVPASLFDRKMQDRIRQASRKGAEANRVRQRDYNGTVLYSIEDILHLWGCDVDEVTRAKARAYPPIPPSESCESA